MKPNVILQFLIVMGVVYLSAACSSTPTQQERRVFIDPGSESKVLAIAKRYIGRPYRYGGNNPSGFDCSGLVSYVYKKAGFKLPRDTRNQYSTLRPVKTPKPGDLVFFRVDGKSISHVGIYAGNFRFIHAPSTGKHVSYSDIRGSYWRKRYAGSRTIFW